MKERFEVLDRELASREFDGMKVDLMWVPGTKETYVTVEDSKLAQRYHIPVKNPAEALNAFRHPFSYYAELEEIATGEDYADAA